MKRGRNVGCGPLISGLRVWDLLIQFQSVLTVLECLICSGLRFYLLIPNYSYELTQEVFMLLPTYSVSSVSYVSATHYPVQQRGKSTRVLFDIVKTLERGGRQSVSCRVVDTLFVPPISGN